MNNAPSSPIARTLADYVDLLQASGIYTVTDHEISVALHRSDWGVDAAIGRLRYQGRLVYLRQGMYAIVPAEYRSVGAPPPHYYLDSLMRHFRSRYYVGLSTAAALHGASSAPSDTFHVVCDRLFQPLSVGRGRVKFHITRLVSDTAVERIRTSTGVLPVSTLESTIMDLVRHAHTDGGWDHACAQLAQIAGNANPDLLMAAASKRGIPEVQRAGYLLDLVGEHEVANWLLRLLAAEKGRSTVLDYRQLAGDSRPDPTWRVRPNVPLSISPKVPSSADSGLVGVVSCGLHS